MRTIDLPKSEPIAVRAACSLFVQQSLFPADTLRRIDKPIELVLRDPNRPSMRRIMLIAAPKMRLLLELLGQAAGTDETVLFLGESGTGKNWLAWLLHWHSARRHRAFVELNVHEHPETLLDSALFGHEKGAFTGASQAQPGKLVAAEGGTLFINEVGDLPISSQMKLLRFLDDRVFEPVGASVPRLANVRVVAATHHNLLALVKQGQFREDLYYRLNVISLRVPPLRERPEEIPPIAERMLGEICESSRKPPLRWDPESLALISGWPWTGNLRSLRNFIVKAVVRARGNTLGPDDLGGVELEADGAAHSTPSISSAAGLERQRFLEAHHSCDGNRSELARRLGTSRSQIRRKIREYGLENNVGQGPPTRVPGKLDKMTLNDLKRWYGSLSSSEQGRVARCLKQGRTR